MYLLPLQGFRPQLEEAGSLPETAPTLTSQGLSAAGEGLPLPAHLSLGTP